jgi:hypothetical protein
MGSAPARDENSTATTAKAASRRGRDWPPADDENIVIGVRDGLAAARKFAQHTGRRLVAFDDLDALIRSEIFSTLTAGRPRTCLLSPGGRFPTARLQECVEASARCGLALGFIAGWTDDAAGKEHVATLLNYDRVGSGGGLFLGGLSPLSGKSGGVEVLRTKDPQIASRLAEGAAILGLVTHGNGIDAPVGDEVMCSMVGDVDIPSSAAVGLPSLPCRHGGPCIRASHTLQGFVDPPRFDPARIRADVLIWCTCWGIMGSDAVFDPYASLARQLLTGGGVGALLTSFRGAPPEGFAVLLAAHLLMRGATLGEALIALNSQAGDDFQPRWVLLGDPAARVAAPGPAPAEPVTADRTTFTMDVEPGLFSVPINDEVTTITAGSADGALSPRSFAVRPIRGANCAIGILLSQDPLSIDFRVWSRTDPAPAVMTLRSIWSSAANLRFAADFFRLAERAGYTTRAADPGLATALEDQADRGYSAMAVSDVDGVLSGSHSLLRAEARNEARRWMGLNARIHEILVLCTRYFGGRLDRIYGGHALRQPSLVSQECRYCGTRLHSELLSPPTPGGLRLVMQCARCRVVTDSPQYLGGAWLDGDETVYAGSVARFTLSFDSGCVDAGCVHSRLTFGGEVPWSVIGEAKTTSIIGYGRDAIASIPLEIQIRESAPEGRYFIIAPTVIDGALAVARRPIVILPPNPLLTHHDGRLT